MIAICCRTSVYPLDQHTAAAVLEVGLFRPVYWLPSQPHIAVNWERVIPEEGTVVNASLTDGSLELNISPAISVFAHHEGKRIAASVYFEIAAKYAEKVGGEIIQRATVIGCKGGDRPQELILARYPSQPMMWDRICNGFQAVLLGEHEEEDTDAICDHGHPHIHEITPDQVRLFRGGV